MKSNLIASRKKAAILVSPQTLQRALQEAKNLKPILQSKNDPRLKQLDNAIIWFTQFLGTDYTEHPDDSNAPYIAQTAKRDVDFVAQLKREFSSQVEQAEVPPVWGQQASTGSDPWVTDRDAEAKAKPVEQVEVPRLASAPMPQAGTPEWHRLQVAKKTLRMPDAMANIMGGMTKDEARDLLILYGLNPKPYDRPEGAHVATKKTAQPAPAPAAPAAAGPVPPAVTPNPAGGTQAGNGNISADLKQMSSEQLANIISAISKNVEMNDKASLDFMEVLTKELKERPAVPEAAPAPKSAAEESAGEPEIAGGPDLGFGGLNMAAAEEEKTASGSKIAVTPPGISEKTMHELKDDPSVKEPYAVAWAIHNKQKEGSFQVVAVTPPGVSEELMHKLKDQYPGEPEKAYATAWKIHNEKEGSAKSAAGNDGSWWVNVHEQTGDVEESGGRTPEVEEAHNLVEEGPAKLDRPETTLPEKLADCRVRTDSGLMGWKGSLQGGYKDFEEFKAYSDTYSLAERLGFGSAEEAWEANPTVQGSVEPSDFRVADKPKVAAEGMTASKALKKAEKLAEQLKGMYLDAKEITEANDSRPVREAVEAIYRAYDMLGLAAKVLGKQQMQEDAEAEAIKVKEKGKKKGSLLDSLVLAAEE